MEDDVERAWASIIGWLGDNAPATAEAIRAPAGEQELADAQQETGGSWPADVVAFYRLCNGTERSSAGYLLPGFCPLPLHGPHQLGSVTGSWSWRQEWLADAAREWAAQPPDPREENLRRVAGLGPAPNPFDTTELDAAPAGTRAMLWLPSWLPIAEDQSGSLLVCDRRWKPRTHHGAVAEFDREEGFSQDAPWRSLSALASATFTALRTGRAVSGTRLHPVAVGSRLTWDVAARDPLELPDGVTVELPVDAGWTALPDTDLEVTARSTSHSIELRYRRRPAP